ncbi:MAG: hypothetical protein HYY16_09280 [Planctomycetes bacterium]|nr:hypothetical protein [Planctomycetota bacterium]
MSSLLIVILIAQAAPAAEETDRRPQGLLSLVSLRVTQQAMAAADESLWIQLFASGAGVLVGALTGRVPVGIGAGLLLFTGLSFHQGVRPRDLALPAGWGAGLLAYGLVPKQPGWVGLGVGFLTGGGFYLLDRFLRPAATESAGVVRRVQLLAE